VAQTTAKIVLEPIFEEDYEDIAYGYRQRHSAIDAVKEAHRMICPGYTDVVDSDLSHYLGTIPHANLFRSVARRIVDRHVLELIQLSLKAPVEERDGDGTRRMSGGKGNACGTPQGGVASPVLAVIYVNRFLKHWRLTGCGEAFHAHIVCYADDVRHITWRWIPFPERRGLEEMTLGPTAYPAVKAKGDSSMPIKRTWSEDAYGHGLQGPRDKVRAALLEPQPPAMQAYIPRHSV
jgi:retron-type reverse transcriptase